MGGKPQKIIICNTVKNSRIVESHVKRTCFSRTSFVRRHKMMCMWCEVFGKRKAALVICYVMKNSRNVEFVSHPDCFSITSFLRSHGMMCFSGQRSFVKGHARKWVRRRTSCSPRALHFI